MLSFYYGTMGSGKSTAALQAIYDMNKNEFNVKVWSGKQRVTGQLQSRLGLSVPCEEFDAETDFIQAIDFADTDHVVVDEAQFLTVKQVDQLIYLSSEIGVPVTAFGLFVAFNGKIFPASERLFIFADRKAELPIIPNCACGEQAVVPARFVNGKMDVDGPMFVVGDLDTSHEPEKVEDQTEYKSLCKKHFLAQIYQKERNEHGFE